MSVSIKIYKNFSKKKNSTKQPTGGTTVNVLFKDDCTVESPVFLIKGVDLDANYCLFNGAYYYIDDIVLRNNDIYELHCSKDVLATYKSTIGSYNAFIERAASSYDDKINDRMLSSQQLITNATQASTAIGLSNTGCLVFRTASSEGVSLYATTSMELLGAIYQNSTYGTSQTMWDSIVQSIGMSAVDASQYLLNVLWVPYSLSDLAGTSVTSIDLGFWDYTWPVETGWTCKKLSDMRKGTTRTLSMPTSAYTDFRAYSPEFSRYAIYLPGVGTVPLNTLDSHLSLSLSVECDLISGGVGYVISNTSGGNYIATFNGQLGVNIPMVSTNINSAGFLETVAGTVAAVAMAETGIGAAAAAAAGTVSAIKTIASEQGSINGYAGNIGFVKSHHQVIVSLEQFGSKQFPLSVAGRPLCEYKAISTLSGFIKCGAASIDIPGKGPDKDAVNSYLNGGFYYE